MSAKPRGLALVAGVFLLLPTAVSAQEAAPGRIVPTNHVVISGYGTVGYSYLPQGEHENAFNSTVNPILLFQFQDKVLFESELEFELEEGVTQTGLEYAQLDFMANDHLTLVGGKFLLPFGVFGERLHPTWINRFPTAPPIYGHHVSAFGAEPMFPVLSDVGVMARAMMTVGSMNLALNAYVTQGPGEEEGGMAMGGVPEVHFPASSEDNNKNKLVGGRLDIVLPPIVELNLSAFKAGYDSTGVLDLTAWNIAAETHFRGFELRGELLQRRQEILVGIAVPVVVRTGWYAQGTYRWKTWEPVLRWTRVSDTKQDGTVLEEGASQLGIGLNYWFNPSIAVMAGYELNREKGTELDNDRIVVHVAFGF